MRTAKDWDLILDSFEKHPERSAYSSTVEMIKAIQLDAEESMRHRTAYECRKLIGNQGHYHTATILHGKIMNLPSEVTAENIQGME